MSFTNISKSINRIDSSEKLKGEAKYLCDYKIKDLLYAKTVRSSIPRGKIKNIKIPNLPNGYFIVDKNDIPGKNVVKIIHDDMPFFADEYVNYIGEPILLIVGPNKAEIIKIIKGITIEYEEIEPIIDIDDALNCNKQYLFNKENTFAKYKVCKGNPDETFKNSQYVFEDTYETGYQEHIYLETQSMLGTYENGNIKVHGSMQCPYYVKNALIQGLNMPEEKVHVAQTTTGGAFGGKEEYPSLIAGHAAFAALKCNRPVLLIFDRNEDIECTTKRHPSRIKYKAVVNKQNKIVAMDIDIILDGGAYAGLSQVILQRAMFAATGVYDVKNVRINGRVLSTNNVVSGAYRGFGAPQAYFALEMFINKLSNELNIDSMEFKKINFLKQGSSSCTNGTFREKVPLENMLLKLKENCSYNEFMEKKKRTNKLIGLGVSMFYHGCGFTGSGERDHIKAKVKLKKHKNEEVDILISNVEMGQGTKTTLRKIISQTLDIPMNKINYPDPDTEIVPDSGPTVASRTIMIVGKLLNDAAVEMKVRWNKEEEFEVLTQYKHPEGFNWDDEKLIGDAYVAYSWGANAVEVEVDPITYEVNVKGIWSVFDIGTPIDEKIVYGQIDGGMMQGLGYASIEVMNSSKGKLLQKTNTDYVIPTSLDFPRIHRELHINPSSLGPYGAKGLGEVSFVGIPAAYSLAVENALGMQIKKLPVTPEYIMEVLK